MRLSSDSLVIIVQNQETDPEDRLLNKVKVVFEQAGIPVEVISQPSRNAPIHRPSTRHPDLVVVLGGDGTFLRASRCFIADQVPLVGVNTGHLGFLTRIEANKVDEYFQAILSGKTTLEYRMMLAVQSENQLALNDVVVKNSNPSRLAKVNVFIDKLLLAAYDADGVIVCTPTGSTAYNLSAGGPIMDPEVDVLAITPICPHSLSAKPIVVPATKQLRIQSDPANPSDLICAIDGDETFLLGPGKDFVLFKSEKRLPLVSFTSEDDRFYAVLKRKLDWGANPRLLAQSRIKT